MLVLLTLLAVWWPFHAKKHVNPALPPITVEQQDADASEGRCEKEGDLWFFLGGDSIIGFSHASCGKAYRAWINMHIDPVKMSKV